MNLTVDVLSGIELHAALDDLARLRIAVFSDWPYLYKGDLVYEADYLHEFMSARDSVLVAARDGQRVVGAATASPMWAQKREFRVPFEVLGLDTRRMFYFGESVLLPEYRGRGIGHAFFDLREARARACGAEATTFAAVIRSETHPSRPAGYVPLDGFWRKRGYEPVAGLVSELVWQEHGETGESPKPMQYWMRHL